MNEYSIMPKRLTCHVVVWSFVIFSGPCLVSQVLAQDASIVIRVVGNTFEIVKTLQDARKVLRVGMDVLVDKEIYDSLYADFVDGRLDLNVDKVNTLPRWNWLVRKRLVKSELTFQWKMMHFLESRGLSEEKTPVFRSLKEALFAEQEAAEAGNADQGFFNNIMGQRHALIRLREQLGSTTTSRDSPPRPEAPTVTFSANPTEIHKLESSTLVWHATNAEHCKISGGTFGTFGPNNSLLVFPRTTTTYAVTCVGPGGSASRLVTVTVTE